jgi:hypothetical protein
VLRSFGQHKDGTVYLMTVFPTLLRLWFKLNSVKVDS